VSGTEDSILSTIPDFQGSDDGGTQGGQTGDSGQGQSSAQPTQGGTGGQSTSAQPGQQAGTGGTDQRTPQQPVRRRHDGLVEVPNADNPNTRDLVDPISGRTVARGGIERKIFEDGQRAARENNQLKTELGNAKRMLSQVNETVQEAVRLNVAPQDQVIAIRVMADFMRDPVKTLQYLAEEVKAKGYQIPFLEQGISPGMDLAAISRMIDGKLQPITQQHQMTIQQQQMRQRAEADLNNFLEENQEANANIDVLAEMLQAQPNLSLSSAYTKMIRWAHENGLDWTQNLKQQIAALQQRSQQPTNQQNTQQDPRRPLPGNRGVSQRGAAPINGSGNAQYNENASWADIIRASMQENGVTFN
jgi:hypothetical protein